MGPTCTVYNYTDTTGCVGCDAGCNATTKVCNLVETYVGPGDCGLDCASYCTEPAPSGDPCGHLCMDYTIGQLCSDPVDSITCEMYNVGSEAACPDCSLPSHCGTNGWEWVSGTYTCPDCSGDYRCTCQDQRYRTYTCTGGVCDSTLGPVDTVQSGCLLCAEGCADGLCRLGHCNNCTTEDSCDRHCWDPDSASWSTCGTSPFSPGCGGGGGGACDPVLCEAQSGSYAVGIAFTCCQDADTQCNGCQENEERTYFCVGDICNYTADVAPTTYNNCGYCIGGCAGSTCANVSECPGSFDCLSKCDGPGGCDQPDCTETFTPPHPDACIDGNHYGTCSDYLNMQHGHTCPGGGACDAAACSANTRWYDVGAPYACCDGDTTRTCQNEEYRVYTCSGDVCGVTVTATNTNVTDPFFCPSLDVCGAYGACDYVDVCDEDGFQTRTCTGHTCVPGPGTCGGADYEDTITGGVCERTTACPPVQCAPACPVDTICWSTTCIPVDGCTTHADCGAAEHCFGFDDDTTYNRCVLIADGPCDGINCPVDHVCHGGSCFPVCSETEECDPDHVCYDGRCVPEEEDACYYVQCPVDYECYQGGCFPLPTCTDNLECEENHYCFPWGCTPDPCHDIDCPLGFKCHMGTCFDECTVHADCDTDPAKPICINNRCTDDPCDDIFCAAGTTCYQGTCIQDIVCTDDDVCNEDHHCFIGQCIPGCPLDDPTCTIDGCDMIECGPEQICERGTCFDACDTAKPCFAPFHCFGGRCAVDSCQAKLDDYDENHIFRTETDGYWPTIRQRTQTDYRPRPIRLTGGVTNWQTTLTNRLAAAQPAPNASQARVALFLDVDKKEYVLLLLHGRNHTDTPAMGASYSIKYGPEDIAAGLPAAPVGDVLAQWGAVEVTLLDDGGDLKTHHLKIENATGAYAGVALGPFPAAEQWAIHIQSTFRGGIDGWNFYSAEAYPGDLVNYIELNMQEEILLTPTPLFPRAQTTITPQMGVTHCEPAGTEGICAQGSWGQCRYGHFTCTKTVASLGYELCDGRDTTCDGIPDTPSKLKVPMAYIRQEGGTWLRMPSVDTDEDAYAHLDFTDHSTDVRRLISESTDFASELQAADHSLFFFHRNLKNGIFSMPLIHGARHNDADGFDADEPVDMTLRFNGDAATTYSHPRMLSIAWYDEWQDTSHTPDELNMGFELRKFADGTRESDGAVAQFMWNGPLPPQPMQFAMDFDLPDSMPRLRAYTPHLALRGLYRTRPVDVRIELVDIGQSMCMADTEVEECRATSYTCSPSGKLECIVTSADDCDATGCFDRDGDGFWGQTDKCPEGLDCNDDDDTIHPDALEACDGVDRNCDGLVDAIGPASMNERCPDGRDACGPAECNYQMNCSCDGAPSAENCRCGGGLDEDQTPNQSLPGR
ncbi:MAG: putative metal-binding motif-containing protein [Bradymonadaceae bacterium]